MHTLQNQVKSKVRIKAQRQKLNCHFKKYSIRTATITVNARLQVSSNRPVCQARRLPRRPVSSNWPAATPTVHFLSGPSASSPTGHFLSGPSSGDGPVMF